MIFLPGCRHMAVFMLLLDREQVDNILALITHKKILQVFSSLKTNRHTSLNVTKMKSNEDVQIYADYKFTINKALQQHAYLVPVIGHPCQPQDLWKTQPSQGLPADAHGWQHYWSPDYQYTPRSLQDQVPPVHNQHSTWNLSRASWTLSLRVFPESSHYFITY